MKNELKGLVASAFLLVGSAGLGMADTTTITHTQSPDGLHSKTVVKKGDGSKTIVKRHVNYVKKIHKAADGSKTVIKKTEY